MAAQRQHPNERGRVSLPPELRRTPVPAGALAWVARQMGAAVVDVRRLPGASTSAVHVVRLSTGRRLVLRRYAWPGFLQSEPDAPAREADVLALLRGSGLPAPELVAADRRGDEVGDGTPAVLMSFLPGRAVADPDLAQLAELAARIHDIDARSLPHRYFPWYRREAAQPPAAATRPALWRAAIDRRLDDPPPYDPRLVHRDLHPGNVLWSRARVAGVVDWANSCRGPWGCDVAHCRGNLIELMGAAAADRFQEAYGALTGRRHDPFWEVASVLEHDADHWTPARIREAEARLAAALRAAG